MSLLGTFALWLGPHEVPAAGFPRRIALRLFKLIGLQPKHQLHRDQVLDLLWPHLTPQSATAQLYKAIYHVRTAFAGADPDCPVDTLFELGDELLRLRAPGGVHTDVAAFEQVAADALHSREVPVLQRAIACYTGDLLPADCYEEWTISRRNALQTRLLDLLTAVGRRYRDGGYLAEAADAFRRVLMRDETREDVHRALMRVYAMQGSRARALRQYQLCVDVLARELDVEPSRETTALYDDIRHDQVQPAQVTQPLSALELPLLAQLVGRQTERAVLRDCLDHLERGTGSTSDSGRACRRHSGTAGHSGLGGESGSVGCPERPLRRRAALSHRTGPACAAGHNFGRSPRCRSRVSEAVSLSRTPGCSGAAYTLSRQIELLTAAGEAQAGWELVSTGLEMAGQAAIRDHCIMLVHAAGIRNRLSVSDLDAAELVQAALQHDTATSLCPVCSVDKHAAMAAYYVAAGDLTTALNTHSRPCTWPNLRTTGSAKPVRCTCTHYSTPHTALPRMPKRVWPRLPACSAS